MLTVVVSASSGSRLPEIVYSARYFNQGTQKSTYQIYTCQLDGSNRKPLTSGPTSHTLQMWIDRWHLACLEFSPTVRRSFSSNETWYGRLWVLDLRTSRRKMLKSFSTHQPWAGVDRAKNYYILQKNVAWKVEPTKVKSIKIIIGGQDERDGPLPLFVRNTSFRITGDSNQQKLKVDHGVKSDSFDIEGEALDTAAPLSARKYLVVTSLNFQRFECNHWVYQVDTEKPSIKTLVKDVGYIVFDSSKSYWLAGQTESRPTKTLADGRQVWVNWLYSGSLQQPNRWTIADGLVDVESASFRPEK